MKLTFLKLGGSLITDKTRPYTPRMDKLAELAAQIAAATHLDPGLCLVLGHGSGSFGHAAASQNWPATSNWEAEDWRGFAEVWYQASALNRLVMDALHSANLPAISFPPSAATQAENGTIEDWYIKPLRNALKAGILPVIFGDVAFDATLNGTILSTEDLFFTLASHLHPQRILLAGLEKGVWADFPARTKLVKVITPENYGSFSAGMAGAAGMDVTGGMASKVEQMLALVAENPGTEVLIFSGEAPNTVKNAVLGMNTGTLLRC